jgi:hypothetical protein
MPVVVSAPKIEPDPQQGLSLHQLVSCEVGQNERSGVRAMADGELTADEAQTAGSLPVCVYETFEIFETPDRGREEGIFPRLRTPTGKADTMMKWNTNGSLAQSHGSSSVRSGSGEVSK